MLVRNFFIFGASLKYFTIPVHKIRNLFIVVGPVYNKSGGSCVKKGVVDLYTCIYRLIVASQRFDKICLSADATDHFKMVENEGFLAFAQPFINFVVPAETQVYLSPEEICVLDGLFLGDLLPITT